MTFNRIRYFMVAAEYCNFRKAAAELFVSEQVLSKQIKALEDEMDVKLFERVKQRVYLTEVGIYVYESMRPILLQIDQVMSKAKTMSQTVPYKIGLQDIRDLVDDIVPELEMNIHGKLEAEAEFVVGNETDMIHKFAQREIELLITFLPDLKSLKIPYEYTTLKKIGMGVVCSKEHPFAQKKSLHFSDLKDEIIYVFSGAYVKDMDVNIINACKKVGFYPRELKHYPDWKNMELALRKGTGVTVVYEYFLQKQTHLTFVPLELDEDDNYNHLVAVWQGEKILPVVQLLKEIEF